MQGTDFPIASLIIYVLMTVCHSCCFVLRHELIEHELTCVILFALCLETNCNRTRIETILYNCIL